MSINEHFRFKRQKNGAGWIITYADTMGLLLTFFIVLVSFSKVDATRYRNVADAMEKSFGPQATNQLTKEIQPQMASEPAAEPDHNVADPLQQQLTETLGEEIKHGMVDVTRSNERVVIRFPERFAFPTARADINLRFNPVIDKVIPILAKTEGTIIVAGHTDDIPIHNDEFRSNWELSSSRAVSVIHAILERSNIPASRFVAEGHGDTLPIFPNNNANNRAANRRVEITIKEQKDISLAAPPPIKVERLPPRHRNF